MFVDAASGHIKVEFQTFFSAQETIEAIKHCKQEARAMESLFKNASLTMAHHSCQRLQENTCWKKDNQASSQELEVIVRMAGPKEMHKR